MRCAGAGSSRSLVGSPTCRPRRSTPFDDRAALHWLRTDVYLADTSAWIWSRRHAYPELRKWFDDELVAGNIATCDIVKLELLYGTRSAAEHRQRRDELDALVTLPIGRAEWTRAIDVQDLLAQLGANHQKVARPPDLLVAAAAETSGVEVLHYDTDFDWIERVTGQPMRRLAAAGSLA